jgi:trigger factor
MSASIESLNGLERRITISVPAAEVDQAYQSRLKQVAKNAKMPGFRPGKVPDKVLDTRFGKGILEEIASELMQTNFHKAIEGNHIHVAGMPRVEIKKALKRGEPLEFVVNFEVYPEIKLNSIKGENLVRNQVKITEADIDKMLDTLSKQHAEWNIVDRAAKIGDRVVIDFEGSIDGKPFAHGDAKDFTLELGSKRMIEGFEDGVVGAKPNEVREIKVTFPKEYPSEELAGQKAVFKITVHKINEPKLPALDDAFAAKLGLKEGGIAELRAEIRKGMEGEAENLMKNQFKMSVLEKLMAKNPIDIPNALVEAEINHLQQMTRNRIAMQTKNEEQAKKMELPREPYVEQAKKRVMLGLLLGEYIKQHNIKVDQDQVKKRIEEIAATYHKPEEVISWYYNNKKMLAEIEAVVLEDQAVSQLLSELTVEDKEISYEAALKQQAAE